MKLTATVMLLLLARALPAAGQDTACDPLAERLSPAAPPARALTAMLCRYAASQKWIAAGDLESAQTPADFRQLLRKRSGKDPLDIGQSMFESFERTAAAIPATPGWLVRDTPHYRLFVRPGSVAARDLDIIAAEVERSRAGIAGDFALEPALTLRERAISTPSPPDAAPQEPSTRVAILLYQNRADDKEGHVGRNSMGATQFGATIESGKGRLRTSIHVLYDNLFSIAVIEHEIAHATVMLAAFDPAAIDKPLAGENELKKAFFAGYHKIPAFLNEGVGDYGLYYAGFYRAWGLLGSPESLADGLRREGSLPPLDRLLRGDAMMHAREHKTYSLAAATFLRYLLQTQTPEAVRDWLFSGDAAADAMPKRFGMAAADVEKAWASWLATAGGKQ
jgi:hypothetical protein